MATASRRGACHRRRVPGLPGERVVRPDVGQRPLRATRWWAATARGWGRRPGQRRGHQRLGLRSAADGQRGTSAKMSDSTFTGNRPVRRQRGPLGAAGWRPVVRGVLSGVLAGPSGERQHLQGERGPRRFRGQRWLVRRRRHWRGHRPTWARRRGTPSWSAVHHHHRQPVHGQPGRRRRRRGIAARQRRRRGGGDRAAPSRTFTAPSISATAPSWGTRRRAGTVAAAATAARPAAAASPTTAAARRPSDHRDHRQQGDGRGGGAGGNGGMPSAAASSTPLQHHLSPNRGALARCNPMLTDSIVRGNQASAAPGGGRQRPRRRPL